MKKNLITLKNLPEQEIKKEEIAITLKNMLADNNLAIDFSKNVDVDFFSWNKNLVNKKNSNFNEIAMNATLLEIDSDDFSIISNRKNNLKNFRFSADMAFCFLKFSDFLNEKNYDLSGKKLAIFNEFERLRLVIKSSESYLGVAKNILEIIARNITSLSLDSSEISPSIIFLTRNNNLKEIINKYPEIVDYSDKIIKNFNSNIIEKIDDINKNIDNYKIFFELVYELILMLEDDLMEKNNSSNQDQNQEESSFKKDQLISQNDENIDQEINSSIEDNEEKKSEEKLQNPQIENEKITNYSLKESTSTIEIIDQTSIDSSKIAFKNPYKIYTDKFDEIIFPNKLIKKEELKNLRNQLDLRINKMNSISKKMRMKLKRKLLSKRNSFLEYDSSRGVLDRKKLTRIIIDSQLQDIWVNNKNHEYQDTALTILLDNSGSMRGNPIIMSALACEIIADILQNFAVKTEIIGFTTGDWKGGRVRKMWEISNRPENPGRLNELRHIIYKHFNQNFKKAKINLGLMLKEGILKENIDGEALLFAKSRLMQQSEKRKILLVISDGTPVDDSTSHCNSEEILSQHLHHVINNIEKKSKIEIVGIGIGHSTEEFYRNSISIKNLDELGDVMIEKIADLL